MPCNQKIRMNTDYDFSQLINDISLGADRFDQVIYALISGATH
jgi:hypothetical protein